MFCGKPNSLAVPPSYSRYGPPPGREKKGGGEGKRKRKATNPTPHQGRGEKGKEKRKRKGQQPQPRPGGKGKWKGKRNADSAHTRPGRFQARLQEDAPRANKIRPTDPRMGHFRSAIMARSAPKRLSRTGHAAPRPEHRRRAWRRRGNGRKKRRISTISATFKLVQGNRTPSVQSCPPHTASSKQLKWRKTGRERARKHTVPGARHGLVLV